MERLKRCLRDQGLEPVDIPKVLLSFQFECESLTAPKLGPLRKPAFRTVLLYTCSPFQRYCRAYLGPHNRTAQPVVALLQAFVIHEIIGLGMAVGFWSACYAVQPSRRFFTPLSRAVNRHSSVERLYNSALVKASHTVDSMAWLKKAPVIGRDTTRLTVGLAESIALRACIKPVTFPFKIWASYQLVMMSKHPEWQRGLARLPLVSST